MRLPTLSIAKASSHARSSRVRLFGRLTGILLWLGIIGATALVLYAYLLPDLGNTGRGARIATYIAFMARTFTFHIGIAVGAAAIVAWLLKMRRAFIAAMPLVLCAIVPPAWMCIRPLPRPDPTAMTLKVLSANLLVSVRDTSLILAEIEKHEPDIILFQEYTGGKHSSISPALLSRYPHVVNAMRDDAYGMAVYSRLAFTVAPQLYPSVWPPVSSSENSRRAGVVNLRDPQIRVVVRVAGQEVVVQNIHVPPPSNPNYLAEQRMLLRWIADWAGSETRPVIVAGDFNSTREAQSAGWLKKAGLVDAHGTAGRGRGSTWPDLTILRHFPGVRIDNLYTRGGLACRAIEVGDRIGSDHRPIVATLELRPR